MPVQLSQEKSSTFGAAVNLAKACIGSGILALPYATARVGLISGPIILALVAIWNAVACRLIVECKNKCLSIPAPHGVSSTYSKIAYVAIGFKGVFLVDFSLIFTLIGVCIATQITVASMMMAIPGNFLSNTAWTILSGIICIPLCLSKDVGFLAPYSFLGLLCLIIGIVAILYFGMESFGSNVFIEPFTPGSVQMEPLSYFPTSLSGLAIFLGVANFCFEIASLAFSVEESMEHRENFQTAVLYCLVFVWLMYVIIADGAALLYIHDPQGIHENILSNLPQHSLIAALVRIMMAFVCLLTYPLSFYPPLQIIEYFIQHYWATHSHQYQRIPSIRRTDEKVNLESAGKEVEGIHHSGDDDDEPEIPFVSKVIIRITVIILTTFFATAVPCFGTVISLVGCFTISIIAFILPPLFHLYIITLPKFEGRGKSAIRYQSGDGEELSENELNLHYWKGLAQIGAGLLLAVVSTTVTILDAVKKFESGQGCS